MYFLYGTMRGPLCQSGTHFHSCASFRGCCATNPCKNEKGECPASLKYPRDAAPKQVTEELLAALGEPSLAALGVEAGNQVLNPLDAVAVLPPFRAGSATLSGSATTTSTIMGTPSSRLHGGIGAEKISGFITAAVGSFTLVLLLSLFIMAYTKDPVNRRYKRDHGSGADNHQVDAESLFALDSEDERSRNLYELDSLSTCERCVPATPNNTLNSCERYIPTTSSSLSSCERNIPTTPNNTLDSCERYVPTTPNNSLAPTASTDSSRTLGPG